MPRYINVEDALQAHPEFLNEQIDDHDKAVYAKGWNACNSAFYGAIKELPTISPDDVRGIGKWLNDVGEFGFPEIPCSVCGYKSGHYGFKYCPNCGAKMEVSE